MELDGAGHQVGAGVDELRGEGGLVGEEPLGLGGVGAHARSSELVDGAEGSGGGAGAFDECGDPGVAVEDGELVGGASLEGRVVAADAVDVVDPLEQHPDSFEAAGHSGAAQLFLDKLLGCGVGEAEAGLPDGGRSLAEAVVEQELEWVSSARHCRL
jgi:hypothetical protein